VELRAGRVLLVGHKGAAALAPENTLRSLELAVELGCDLVEFDVLALDDGTLVLAHSDDLGEVSHGISRGRVRPLALAELRAAAPELPTLDEALAFLGDRAPRTGLHLDLKAPGDEREVIEALRRHGAVERAVVSTVHASSVRAVGMIEPRLARGLTYPHDRHGIGRRRLLSPAAGAGLGFLRRSLPWRIGRLLARADASAAMLHHQLVSPAVVARAHALGAAVFAWTVDDEATLDRVVAAGVDAVITNDPRIFRATLRQ
jgi:glycerophosphoryl diester phosphodiesterase